MLTERAYRILFAVPSSHAVPASCWVPAVSFSTRSVIFLVRVEADMGDMVRPVGTILLSGAFLATGLLGLVASWGALPRTSNTSPLASILALLFASTCLLTAALTWRRSRFAAYSFAAAIGLLLLPARYLVPGGQVFVPSLVVLAVVGVIGFQYLRRVHDVAAHA